MTDSRAKQFFFSFKQLGLTFFDELPKIFSSQVCVKIFPLSIYMKRKSQAFTNTEMRIKLLSFETDLCNMNS